jgi:hypothetical protein
MLSTCTAPHRGAASVGFAPDLVRRRRRRRVQLRVARRRGVRRYKLTHLKAAKFETGFSLYTIKG